MSQSKSILDGIDNLIEEWLGIDGVAEYGKSPKYSSKTAAMALSANGGPLKTSVESNLLARLLKRIQANWEQAGCHPPSSETWELGKETWLSPENVSQEVILERLIVRLLDEKWTNQVPTCSGLIKGAQEGKRSIDLIRSCGGEEYEFIELKFKDGTDGRYGSNNPLEAGWEIIEYGLLYAHARQNKLRSESPLMNAKAVHLVVLAPMGWYQIAPTQRYEFGWYEDLVNAWLREWDVAKLVRMDFQFQMLTKEFDALYNEPKPLAEALQAFRRADLRDRQRIY